MDGQSTPEHAPENGRSSRWIIAAQAMLLAGVVGLFLWTTRAPVSEPESLPVMGTLPEFSLTSAGGERVTLADLRGSVWIADFIFTRCGGQCADMTARMRELRQALDGDTNVKLVSISVNPSYDTPKVLTNYAQRHDATADRWLFLTGEREAVHALANDGFKMGAMEATEEQRAEGADMFLHSVRFVLVDGEGRIRGYYSTDESDAIHRLLADTRMLARGPAA